MADLSVLIPARNEEWLGHTVADVLRNARADTEVIVVLDGAWPIAGLDQHPKLRVLYHATAIGQRAATNLAARVSDARYLMKLDAHCSVAEGFDVALIEAAKTLGPDVTQIPLQRNLHVYDWVCETPGCSWRQYSGPQPDRCVKCQGTALRRVVVWKPKGGSSSRSWVFDQEPKFQYDRHSKRREDAEFPETMSSLGACFFMERQRFWQIGGLDETHGSWGQFGIEIACKSWLSGGRHVTNPKTWFAHFFRVGGLKFPYPLSGDEQARAREYSRTLWFENRWPGQVKPLSWLVEKFKPVQGWHDAAGAETLAKITAAGEAFTAAKATPAHRARTAGIVYYSDLRPPRDFLERIARRLVTSAEGLPIVPVTLRGHLPEWLGPWVVLDAERGVLTMFRQILAGLERLDTDVAFLAEHDVVYHPSHFRYRPERPDVYAYNQHVYKVDAASGKALHYLCEQTSGLCADRDLLVDHYRRRVAHVEAHGFSMRLGYEPGKPTASGGLDDVPRVAWMSEAPNVDIRHDANLTPSRWRKDDFRNQRYTDGWTESDRVPGWPGVTLGRFPDWFHEATHGNP